MANEKPEKPGGQKITKAEAEKMAKAYQEKNPGKTKSVIFDAEFVRSLVNNPKAETVMFSFGQNENSENTIIITPMDSNGQELDNGDRGSPCPPYCNV